MKKLLILILFGGVFAATITHADDDINFNTQKPVCTKDGYSYLISSKSTVAEIKKHCDVSDYENYKHHGYRKEKVHFKAKVIANIECEYRNKKLHECEIDD